MMFFQSTINGSSHSPLKANNTKRLRWRSLLLVCVPLCCGSAANVLVTSQGVSRSIISYDSITGAPTGAFVPSGSGGLLSPTGLTFGPDGNLYVGDGVGNSVLRYNGATGTFLGAFVTSGSGGLSSPTGVVFGTDGNLYVAGGAGPSADVQRYNGATGAFLGVFALPGFMVNPQQMAFGPNGDLFVADEVNVVEFRGTTGVFVADFVVGGTHGLSGPDGLVFGPGGKLYVAGAGSHNVNQYDANTGAFLSTFISSGLADQTG